MCGPGECTCEHLKVLLDKTDIFQLLFDAVSSLAWRVFQAASPRPSARFTAFTKTDRGALQLDVLLPVSQQFAKEFEKECAPFQCVLSTRDGTDCVGHLLRARSKPSRHSSECRWDRSPRPRLTRCSVEQTRADAGGQPSSHL